MAITEIGQIETVDTLEGVKIIDCDAHWTEPEDLWSSQAPEAWKDRIPVQKTVDGRTAWYLNGEVWASTGGNTITTDRKKVLGAHMLQPFSTVDASAWAVKERLGILDDMGIHAQILYPNGIGFASNHLFAIQDVEQRQAVLQMYNDHLVQVQHESGDRLLPQCVLPIWDMDLTVKEMTRLIDQGIRGFTLSDKPELLGLPELPEPYFAPAAGARRWKRSATRRASRCRRACSSRRRTRPRPWPPPPGGRSARNAGSPCTRRRCT
jgi:hypothetical protein